MNTKNNTSSRILPLIVAVVFISGVFVLYMQTSAVVWLVLGIPGVFAYWLWYLSFKNRDFNYASLLPYYLATAAGFFLHAMEEYIGKYPLAVSSIFGFIWTEQRFVIVLLTLSGLLFLVSIGLFYNKSVAGFLASVFVVSRLAEIALFIFPLIKPTGHYYFPGMYTVVLPIIPSIFYIRKFLVQLKNSSDIPVNA